MSEEIPTRRHKLNEIPGLRRPVDDARIELAAQLRAAIDELVHSSAEPSTLAEVGQLIDAARRVLSEATAQNNERSGAEAITAMEQSLQRGERLIQARPTFHVYGPFSGALNPVAPPIQLRIVDDCVVGEVIYSAIYEGPPGHVHGGVIAGGFDEVLGYLQLHSERPGLTGKLSVAYRRPTPLNEPLVYRAWIDQIDGRKVHASSELTVAASGVRCATAEGMFVAVRR